MVDPSKVSGADSESLGSPPEQPRRVRKAAAERRQSILDAARHTFAAVGNPDAATTKMIASEAGISEAIIYRHFESKEQLFVEAVVDPLKEITATFAESFGDLPPNLTQVQRMRLAQQRLKRLIASFTELAPLLGLVLFGDPKIAQDFYTTSWEPFLAALTKEWTEFYERGGITPDPKLVTAPRVLAGAALLTAIDIRFDPSIDDRMESITWDLTDIMFNGIFLSVE